LIGAGDLRFKYFIGDNVTFFIQPQFGVSIYQYPKLKALFAEYLPFEIRTASTSFGLSLSIRLGTEFKVVDKW
jgi:hypothetical protein